MLVPDRSTTLTPETEKAEASGTAPADVLLQVKVKNGPEAKPLLEATPKTNDEVSGLVSSKDPTAEPVRVVLPAPRVTPPGRVTTP